MKSLIKIFFIIILIQNVLYAEKIKLIKEGGVYSVPVMINNSFKLNFVVDSGAARVSMPYDVFRTLIRTGTINKNDILGTEQYRMANGDIEEAIKINIRSIKIGNKSIYNVLASVDKHMNGMLLLGQSALQKLEPWHMDTKKEIIYIRNDEKVGKKDTDFSFNDTYAPSTHTASSCNDALGCRHLASQFYSGREDIKQDYRKAIKFYAKSCNYGEALSCLKVGFMYRRGQGVKYDFSKIMEFYKKACDADNRKCSLVGELYADGVDIEPDYVKAKKYFTLACNDGDNYGCDQFNKIEEKTQPKKAKKFTLDDIFLGKTKKSYYDLAEQCNKKSDYKCAFDYSMKQLNEDLKKYPVENKQIAKDYNQLGYYSYLLGNNKKSLGYYFKSLKIKEKILDKNDISIAITYNNIGLTYHQQFNYKEALAHYFKALKIQENVLGENNIETAATYNNIGLTYTKQARYDEALVYTMIALKIAQKELGEYHGKTAKSYNNVANTYRGMGRYTIALEYYFKAMKIQEKLLGKNHPETAITYNNIGLAYNSQDNYEQALQYANKALKIVNNKLGENHPTAKIIKTNITEIKINKALAKFKK